ncbi:MAG: ATP-binding protein [Verrucomicrobiota bacterium]|jgi:anti-sigma regulatory factor (Ser/Thr protein kinase)
MKKTICFSSDTCHLAEVRAEVRAFLGRHGFDECATELMVLALDEACTNVIRHAYAHERKPVRLEMTALRGLVRFVLRDYGRTCDPAKIKSRELEDIRPGGLGVHIIKQAFDSVTYSPQPRGTRLVLEKKRIRETHGAGTVGTAAGAPGPDIAPGT